MLDVERTSVHETLELACDLCIGLGAFAVSLTGRIQALVSDPMLPDDGPARIEQLARSCLSHPAAEGHALFWNAELGTEGESAEHLLACVVAPVWAGSVRLGLLGVVDTWLPEPDEEEASGLGALADDIGAALVSASSVEPAGAPSEPVPPAGKVASLRTAEPRLAAVLDHLRDPLAVTAGEGEVVFANQAYADLVGQAADELVGHDLGATLLLRTEEGQVVPPGDHPALRALRDGREVDAQLMLGDLEGERHLQVSARPLAVGGRAGAIVVLRDTTAEWLERRGSVQHALHDPLTGLANRHLMLEELQRMLASLSRRGGSVALVSLDLDDFKRINDEHGSDVGDEVLVAVARRLSGAVRSEDVVARVGGDEFVVAHLAAEQVPDGDLVVSRIRKVLSAPFRVRGQALGVQASVGWVSTDTAVVSSDALLAKADRAMYRHKGDRGLRRPGAV